MGVAAEIRMTIFFFFISANMTRCECNVCIVHCTWNANIMYPKHRYRTSLTTRYYTKP